MSVSTEDIARQMLVLLPDDGTPVLNRVMRVMLARALATDISLEQYAIARSRLETKGQLGLKRGQGGQIFRKPEAVPKQREAAVNGKWSEASLMPWLKKYLQGPMLTTSKIFVGSQCLSYDTSRIGTPGIYWARPDFTLISARKLSFLPSVQLDIHSFELKAENGVNDSAVFEALAHRRFTHFGHLVCHLPKGSKHEPRWPGIQKLCREHGIGLTRIFDPKKVSAWELVIEPIRKETEASVIDQFLAERFQGAEREEIFSLIHGRRS